MRSRRDDPTPPQRAIGRFVVRAIWAAAVGLACLSGARVAGAWEVPAATTSVAATPSIPTPSAGLPNKTPILRPNESGSEAAARTPSTPWSTLAIVGTLLAGLYVASRLLKRSGSARWMHAAPQAVNLLGTTPITPQSAVHVIQVGERLLVVGSGPSGLRTLTELTDPAEVAHVVHLCRAEQSQRSGWNPLAVWSPRRERRVTRFNETEQTDPPATDAIEAARGLEQKTSRFSRTTSRAAVWFVALLAGGTSAWAQSTPTTESASLWSRADSAAVATNPQQLFNEPSAAVPGDGSSPIQRVAYQPEQTAAPVVEPGVVGASSSDSSPSTNSLLELASPQGLGGSLRLGLLVGVMSLAPAILLMTTCYVRFIVVFGLVRQAIGVQQFPPTQVLTALSLFLTGLVMWPVWSRSWREGIAPYTSADASSSAAEFPQALTRTAAPVREFMSRQIEAGGNSAAIDLLMSYQLSATGTEAPQPAYYEDVPLQVLLPAYVLSELKTAFLIGFQLYLPFVVIDLLVSSVLTSLGLGMLSPGVVSLPFKLLLFVLIDGWFLLVEVLLRGIPPLT